MKTNRTLAASALVALIATGAFASTSIDRPAALLADRSNLPVPVTVVHPTDLPREYENATVYLKFTLDQAGVPHNVAPVGPMPDKLASRLIPAVANWKFTPYRDAKGQPIRKNVILPLELVDGRF